LTAGHTPGHAPDHLCFWHEQTRTLLCGNLAAKEPQAAVARLGFDRLRRRVG
jgi:glyoxylase-like metal-dependent hydrolase (beta-lactamase superfamily II)